MSRRTGQHHGDLRRALLDAALQIVSEGRAADVTLREVARRAGVSPAAPYHHFGDKSALLAAVAREGFEALIDTQARSQRGTPGETLAQMSAAYVRFALEHPAHYTLMFQAPPHAAGGPAGEALERSARSAFAHLVAAISDVRPDLSPDRAAILALHAWSHAHGAVQISAWASGLREGFDPGWFADDVGRTILQTVLAAPREGAVTQPTHPP